MRSVLLVGGIVLVAWLNAGAMAVRSASRIWLRHWAERRLRGAATVLVYLERPQRLLAASNAAVAFVLGLAGAWIGWQRAGNPTAAASELAVYAALVVFLGTILPRVLARRFPSAFIPISMPMLRLAHLLTVPILGLGRMLSGAADEAVKPEAPREAMQDLLREGELEGVGGREEIAIISGVVDFSETHASDVMTPLDDVFMVSESDPPSDVAQRIADSAFSRVPVYRGRRSCIVGMFHAFDVLKARGHQLPALRSAAIAAPDTPCNELLFRMLQARQHLAAVTAPDGEAVGIATLEDLLEELVGDIRDEHDEPAASAAKGTPRSQPAVA